MTDDTSAIGRVAYRGGRNLYLNITNRCSADCSFCLREFTDEVYGVRLRLDHEPDVDELLHELDVAFLDGPADEVVFCGLGEPTMRLDLVLAATEWLHVRRQRVRLDTNGHGSLLNPDVDVPAALAAAGLDAVAVSLNAADPETYDRLCRPMFGKAYRAVLEFAEQCARVGIDTTLTAVRHPDVDVGACRAIAKAMGVGFRERGLASPPGESRQAKGGDG